MGEPSSSSDQVFVFLFEMPEFMSSTTHQQLRLGHTPWLTSSLEEVEGELCCLSRVVMPHSDMIKKKNLWRPVNGYALKRYGIKNNLGKEITDDGKCDK